MKGLMWTMNILQMIIIWLNVNYNQAIKKGGQIALDQLIYDVNNQNNHR
jgi:hypothetical protein